MRPADGLLPSSGSRTRSSRDVSGDVQEPRPADLSSLTSLELLGRLEPAGLHKADRRVPSGRGENGSRFCGRRARSGPWRASHVVEDVAGLGDEADDAHRGRAAGTDERIDLADAA